jgi:hypothetical protein
MSKKPKNDKNAFLAKALFDLKVLLLKRNPNRLLEHYQ